MSTFDQNLLDDSDRVLEMLAMLAEFSFLRDQVGWGTWKELSRELPDAVVRTFGRRPGKNGMSKQKPDGS